MMDCGGPYIEPPSLKTPTSDQAKKIFEDWWAEIVKSDYPFGAYWGYLAWIVAIRQFADDGINYLSSKGAELGAFEFQKPEEKACKDVRRNREESRDEGNSGYQARSHEGNR